MGLNLETLIVILFLLILVIIGDGVRRVLRDRGSRLRVRIDPGLKDLAEDDGDERNPELPSGSARVINRDNGPQIGDTGGVDEDAGAPPVMMEPEPAGKSKPAAEASQPDLFADTGEPADESPAPAPSAHHEPPQPAPTDSNEPPAEPAGAREILEVMVVHLVSPPDQVFQGRELLQQLLEQGMRFGEMSIFHCHGRTEQGSELLFSMANAMEPGTFDIDDMEKGTFRGVTFFMKLPGPSQPLEALDRMVSVSRRLAQGLGGELRDDQRSVLTPQTVEHMRQRIQEFERRQRVVRGG
ncbi:MAG: cell division protein ZipA [Alcanivoracaceae bacterium]|nr:cell division protein ZipA [Alcanivoracaceae bacterium]